MHTEVLRRVVGYPSALTEKNRSFRATQCRCFFYLINGEAMTIIQGGAQLRGAQHDRGRDICTRETNGAGAVGREKLESDVTEDKQTADSDAPPPPRATEGERLAPFAADQQPMGNQHKHQRGPLLSTSNDGRATDRNKRKPKRSEKQRTTTMCVCMSVNKGQAVGQQKAAGDTRRSDESWRKEKRVASSSRLTREAAPAANRKFRRQPLGLARSISDGSGAARTGEETTWAERKLEARTEGRTNTQRTAPYITCRRDDK